MSMQLHFTPSLGLGFLICKMGSYDILYKALWEQVF